MCTLVIRQLAKETPLYKLEEEQQQALQLAAMPVVDDKHLQLQLEICTPSMIKLPATPHALPAIPASPTPIHLLEQRSLLADPSRPRHAHHYSSDLIVTERRASQVELPGVVQIRTPREHGATNTHQHH